MKNNIYALIIGLLSSVACFAEDKTVIIDVDPSVTSEQMDRCIVFGFTALNVFEHREDTSLDDALATIGQTYEEANKQLERVSENLISHNILMMFERMVRTSYRFTGTSEQLFVRMTKECVDDTTSGSL